MAAPAAPTAAAPRSAPARTSAAAPLALPAACADASASRRTPKGRQAVVPADFVTPDTSGRLGWLHRCRWPFWVANTLVVPTSYFELDDLPGLWFCANKVGVTGSGGFRQLCDRCRTMLLPVHRLELPELYVQRRAYAVGLGPEAEAKFLLIIGAREGEEVKQGGQGPKTESVTRVRAALSAVNATPIPSPADGAKERNAASVLVGLPLTTTSPLRAAAPSVADAARRAPASDVHAAFATPPPPLPALPLPAPLPVPPSAPVQLPPLESPPVDGDLANSGASCQAAVDVALEALRRFSPLLSDAEKQLARTSESLATTPTRATALEAKKLCSLLADCCSVVKPWLDAAEASFTASFESMSREELKTVVPEVLSKFKAARSQVGDVSGGATAITATADGVLRDHMPPRHEVSTLDFTYADAVLDDMISKLGELESALHEQQTAKPPPPKRPRRADAFSKALGSLVEVVGEKITGARRMLHLRREARSADSPTYWRGRDPKDENLLQAVLPIEDADANAAFTKAVDAALEAHKSKYVKFTEADEKCSVALMWTDPLVIILRQLSHIDAVHGQAISVTALSRFVDAFIVQCGAPEMTADQLLMSLGLQSSDLVWLKTHSKWLHTKAKEYGLLPLPELCESFMADAVDPGMTDAQMAAAIAEAKKLHAERVADLQRQVDEESEAPAKRRQLLQLLRLKTLRRPSLRVRRGLQAFAQNAQIHAGGGSFKELRLTLFIATHTSGKQVGPYEDDEQTHACHFLFDCCLYELGLLAVFFYRHLSPDAYAHYTSSSPGRKKILQDFMEHVKKAELDAAVAGTHYAPDQATLFTFSKRLYKDDFGTGKRTDVPPWVPAALRAR